MTKKFTLMMLFLLLLGAASFSQTASLATVTASPGQNIPVALNVTGFTGIGAITFNILFDPAVMTFTGLSSAPSGFIAGVTGNTINITGSWYPYTTFGPGKLFDLNFTYSGMTPSPLNFLGTCQVTQGVTVIHPTYTNGSVSMNTGLAQKANLVSATATTGGNVTVPLEYTALPAVGAITQKVHYDPTKLTFVNVQGIGSLAAGLNYSANAGSGIITITWTNIGGTGVNANANKFLLNFVYIGSTVTNVDFVSGCLISTAPSGTNVPVSYFGGIVSLGSASASAVLGSITGVHQGQDNLEVPLTLAGFPTTNVRAFTLTIPYDSPRLSFLGLKTPVSGLVISQASGTLTLAWTDASGVTNVNGIFLTLKFKYNGIGPASVRFGNGCVFNTYNAGVTGTVQVAYTNSIIVPALETATATIGYPLPVTAGNPVLVPINFSGLPLLNMGAATLKITYDYNKLTYIDIQNNTYGASVGHNATTHTITIAWASASAITLTGKFLDLRFMYNGGGGDCGAAVSFVDGCELASYAFPSPIVPANWINGGANLKFKVSGILSYNSDPNAPIPLVGFTVLLKTNPGNITVGTTTTNASGYYEFSIANGNYIIESAAPSGTIWSADLDDVIAMFDYVGGVPLPDSNPLRLIAGDVNQNGDIDLDDVIDVFYKVGGETLPDYTAPEWVFGNLTLTVNCADLPNQNLMGLNSGNVLGSNPTPNP